MDRAGLFTNTCPGRIPHVAHAIPSKEEQIIIEKIILESDIMYKKMLIQMDVILIQINSLMKSILKQAFEGKLVPQDPNDEPASELLKRIKSK